MMIRYIVWTCMLIGVTSAAEVTAKYPTEAHERLSAATTVFKEIMTTPDKGIPQWALERAHCAAIIPAIKQGAFIFGAKYGKGIIVCRQPEGGWTAPSTIRIEGGSFGFQIGGGEVDAIVLVMNEQGKKS